jgi:hypothetical protein
MNSSQNVHAHDAAVKLGPRRDKAIALVEDDGAPGMFRWKLQHFQSLVSGLVFMGDTVAK